MMQVKVCGMRDPENMAAVAQLPIQYMGFIFYPKSRRFVGRQANLAAWLERNAKVLNGINRVGVFVNAELDAILNAVHDYQLDYIQLHGNESPEYCAELTDLWSFSSVRSAKLIKAFSVDEEFDFRETAPYEPHADLFIFDTKGAGYGGTGKQFDWSLLQKYLGTKTFLLSGGIQPESVPAIRQVNHPQLAGVDINSGFEREPALKEPLAIKKFIEALRKNEQYDSY